ncbi:hypothetical protein FDP41_001564 [Naegleria fowleri]|uniref:EGF-like domain-containing protein n=1 Tax=Naegleria fowleri TaxID=5763 RepID=A0A6A5BXI7_NAEFO|nr:uncharacterized protein FDP41_001564 [Naegleria fowleri]KAF0979221.1 hypothetical protein FDP41_001564 [Naegleria fowleri]
MFSSIHKLFFVIGTLFLLLFSHTFTPVLFLVHGSNTNTTTTSCFGISQTNNTYVCSGHGSCIATDVCTCNSGWVGSDCSLMGCFGIQQYASNVCSGHGTCLSSNRCNCWYPWGGENCSLPLCYSVLANATSVCHGRGSCVAPDTCVCNDGFTGLNCELLTNETGTCWDSSVEGAPKPIITSFSTSDGIWFSVNFTQDVNAEFSHVMFIGDNSSFHSDQCLLSGGERVDLKLAIFTPCHKVYYSQILNLEYLALNTNLTTELIGDYLKITIPIALYYLDEKGLSNGGFCRAFKFTTTQVIYVKISATVISSFNEYSPLNPYGVNLYTQQLTTNALTGVLQVQMILRTSNTSLSSFTFYNTTNPNYVFQVSMISFLYQSGPFSFYQIQMSSNVKVNDYRALTFFKASLRVNGVLDELINYIPFKIDYSIVDAPSDKNFSLVPVMFISSADWTSKSVFQTGEKVLVKVQTSSVLGNNHLIVNDAYLCCFKTFTPTLSYNPSQGEYGCSQFNSATMDVWKPIISNRVGNSELETQLIPFPQAKRYYGFSFTLIPSLFPQKYSNTTTSCFVQSNVGATAFYRSVVSSNSDEYASGVIVVKVLPSTKGQESTTRVSEGSFSMVSMAESVCLVVIMALLLMMM